VRLDAGLLCPIAGARQEIFKPVLDYLMHFILPLDSNYQAAWPTNNLPRFYDRFERQNSSPGRDARSALKSLGGLH
jgi:hypothetical protein